VALRGAHCHSEERGIFAGRVGIPRDEESLGLAVTARSVEASLAAQQTTSVEVVRVRLRSTFEIAIRYIPPEALTGALDSSCVGMTTTV
jgi:hypothetical protein